jgi:hypothetical protein
MVKDDERKPWDARLIEWMQRGSGGPEDQGERKMTPKQAAYFALLYVAWAGIENKLYLYVLAGLCVGNFAWVCIRTRKQREQ